MEEFDSLLGAQGGHVLLISDGMETGTENLIADVKPVLIEKNVTVHSILYSEEADPKIESLSSDTCGKSILDIGLGNSTELLAGLISISEVISEDQVFTAFSAKVSVSILTQMPQSHKPCACSFIKDPITCATSPNNILEYFIALVSVD